MIATEQTKIVRFALLFGCTSSVIYAGSSKTNQEERPPPDDLNRRLY
jgi:hypothetical protein